MTLVKKYALLPLTLLAFVVDTQAQPPACQDVHVWYSIVNDARVNWSVQIARLYENNISFVDEACSDLDITHKFDLSPSQTRYLGMKVNVEKGFSAAYSFMGVASAANPNAGSRGRPACLFAIAPYGPGQMNRIDWKINNADCIANNYGTDMHFK